MINLPNGCRCSNPAVFPENWRTKKASTSKPWRISYRFYEPGQKPKQVILAGMNRLKSLEDRQELTERLLEQELDLLLKHAYNPRTGTMLSTEYDPTILGPDTPFPHALKLALARVDGVKGHLSDIESAVDYCIRAARMLQLDLTPIKEIRRRHLIQILDQVAQINSRFSAHRFNKYRNYLSRLFRELVQVEATDANPVRDILAKKEEQHLRELLTPDERKAIDGLKETRYTFWRYIMVFFYSGARTTELFRVRREDVSLERQEFKVLVKKGKTPKEDLRGISDEALELWRELVATAKPGQYLFSRGLKPGDKQIRPDQVNRRWNWYVKETKEKGGLGINKDFYSLKHLHTDGIAEKLSIEHAATADGHTTPVVTMKHYAVGEKKRQLDKVKKAGIRFS
jgi:integrase